MTITMLTSTSNSYRLRALLAFAAGIYILAHAWGSSSLHHALLGAGILLASVFAFRHNLLDISPRGLDPKNIGRPWLAVLGTSVLLILAAAVVAITA